MFVCGDESYDTIWVYCWQVLSSPVKVLSVFLEQSIWGLSCVCKLFSLNVVMVQWVLVQFSLGFSGIL